MDGTKPTDSSEKCPSRIRVTEPCTLKLVCYRDGRAVKTLTKKVKVQLRKPTAAVKTKGENYTYRITAENGAKVYMTLDGSVPSKKNGTPVKNGGIVTIPARTNAKLICVKKGWTDSKVYTLRVGAAPAKPNPADETTTWAAEVVKLVNNERAANGLEELETSDELTQVAQTRAKKITTNYSHTRPDGSSCFTALTEAGIYYYSSGENIAAGYKSPEAVVTGWMNSPGHRANILSPKFNKIGVGLCFADDSYGCYWTQVFTS